jgi:hypothetical protein
MGSHHSGEPLISGETNGSNAPTMIVADNGSFLDTVFVVTPSGDLSIGPEVAAPVNAIIGFGYQGGVGVVGRGDSADEFRPGLLGRGTGGHGVKGLGGSGDAESNTMEVHHPDRSGKFKPGAGVLGIGGYWIGPERDAKGNALRGAIGGPGVVGLGGGTNSEEPYDHAAQFETVKGVGVCGLSNHGPGVFGKSTTGLNMAQNISGGHFESSNGNGVEGIGGAFGVVGRGGRAGGFFRSSADPFIRAQVHLAPQFMSVPKEVPMQIVPNISPDKVDQLPKTGSLGDLLVTASPPGDPNANMTLLWLCTRSGTADGKDGIAEWRQVLLGPPIIGRK